MNKKRKGFAQLLPKRSFVIYCPANDDFLASYDDARTDESKSFALTRWHSHPTHALRFNSLVAARQVALLLVLDRETSIEVCSVSDIGSQFKVETEATFFPSL